jgi:hypothetical protein
MGATARKKEHTMNWFRKLFERAPEPWKPQPLQKRNAQDIWPQIKERGEENEAKYERVSYTFERSCLGNDYMTQAVSERYCVYCKHFSDPEFRDPAFPDGGGHCDSWNGAIGFNDSCIRWRHAESVRWWLSKRYMARHKDKYPTPSWYRVFDDGPDGDKS